MHQLTKKIETCLSQKMNCVLRGELSKIYQTVSLFSIKNHEQNEKKRDKNRNIRDVPSNQ